MWAYVGMGQGAISDMKSRGVNCLYVSSIDNVLAKIGDPMFVGHCDVLSAQCGVKCIRRQSPEERLGTMPLPLAVHWD